MLHRYLPSVLPRCAPVRAQTNAGPRIACRYAHQASTLPTPPRLAALDTPEDTAAARSWIARFSKHLIHKDAVELTFSRSSGPGGQNVNKLNTKATLRCPVDSPWIPMWAHPELRNSPHYVSSSESILMTSTVHRSQAQNIDECLTKLHALIIAASSAPVKNEPSEEQKRRVAALERAEKARRREEKSHRSETKKSRGNGRGGAWD